MNPESMLKSSIVFIVLVILILILGFFGYWYTVLRQPAFAPETSLPVATSTPATSSLP